MTNKVFTVFGLPINKESRRDRVRMDFEKKILLKHARKPVIKIEAKGVRLSIIS